MKIFHKQVKQAIEKIEVPSRIGGVAFTIAPDPRGIRLHSRFLGESEQIFHRDTIKDLYNALHVVLTDA